MIREVLWVLGAYAVGFVAIIATILVGTTFVNNCRSALIQKGFGRWA